MKKPLSGRTELILSERNQKYLETMRLVESVSRSLKTVSWVFGGFTPDIYMGRILREHDDLDYLTLNLPLLKSILAEVFSGRGWQIRNLANGDLKLTKNEIKVQLGNVECSNQARWTHNGEIGSLFFPVSWLSLEVVEFQGTELHVVAPELQYVLKACPALMNPGWLIRKKDLLDKKHLQDILLKKGIDISVLHELVTSACPT